MIIKTGIEALTDSESFSIVKLLLEMGWHENKENNKNNSVAAKILIQIYFTLDPYFPFVFSLDFVVVVFVFSSKIVLFSVPCSIEYLRVLHIAYAIRMFVFFAGSAENSNIVMGNIL